MDEPSWLCFDITANTFANLIRYWRGITEALATRGVEVVTAEVPPSGRIEVRAKELADVIEKRVGGKAVNIIA